jgi:hypothetical protein
MANNQNPSNGKWLDDWLWKFDRAEIYDGPIIPEVKRLMVAMLDARVADLQSKIDGARDAYRALGLAAHDNTPAEMIATLGGFWQDAQEKLEELREHIKDR